MPLCDKQYKTQQPEKETASSKTGPPPIQLLGVSEKPQKDQQSSPSGVNE
jgi:hypothetical protein